MQILGHTPDFTSDMRPDIPGNHIVQVGTSDGIDETPGQAKIDIDRLKGRLTGILMHRQPTGFLSLEAGVQALRAEYPGLVFNVLAAEAANA